MKIKNTTVIGSLLLVLTIILFCWICGALMFYNVSKGIQLSAMFSLIIFLFLAIINAMNSLEQKWFPLNWYRSILVLTLISVLWLPHVFAKIGINDTFNGLIDVTILIIGMYVYIYFGKEDIESIIENSG